eukprot:1159501-Pelagomonas_calceolata.AAC.6
MISSCGCHEPPTYPSKIIHLVLAQTDAASKSHLGQTARYQVYLGRLCGIKVEAFRKRHVAQHVRGCKALAIKCHRWRDEHVPEG